MRNILLLSVILLMTSCLKESEVTFNFGFEVAGLEVILSDSSSGSTTHSVTNNIDIAKSGGDDLTQYCISETQTVAPIDTSAGSCGGGNWVTGFPSSFALSGGDGLKTVYIFGADSSNAISSETVTKTITLDTTDPTAVSALTLGTVPASLSTTPTITWTTDSTDNLVLVGYQVRVVKDSDSSVEQDWTSFTKGDSVSGLSLDGGEDYRIEIRAIDEAGNTSVVVSDTYTTLSISGSLTLGSSAFSTLYQPGGVAPGGVEVITLTNSGGIATGPLLAPVIYGGKNYFEVATDTCTGTSLNPGGTCTIDVRINSGIDGFFLAYMYVGDGSIVSSEHMLQGSAYGFRAGNLYMFGAWDIGTVANVYDPNNFLSVIPNDFTEVTGGIQWASLVGGLQHTCGIDTDSKLYCFGGNWDGEIGHGIDDPAYVPQIVMPEKNWKSVTTGSNLTCAIDSSDDLFCWGYNGSWGRFGNGTTTHSNVPLFINTGLKWKMVSSLVSHTCGIDMNDDMYCWGRNNNGGLGDGTTATATTPVLVNGGHKWKYVATGYYSTCGVTTAGVGYCWGAGARYIIGDGTSGDIHEPTNPVSGGHVFNKIELDYDYACGLTNTNDVYCWGNDSSGYGYLGDGNGTPSTTPVQISGAQTWTDLSVRGSNACAIDSTNQMYCWGYNDDGQLGNGNSTHQMSPVLVQGGHNWSLATGADYGSCGVTTAGKAYCWGYYWNYGHLGNGLYSGGIYLPKKFPSTTTWKKVSAGYSHFCGIDQADDLYCTGGDDYGEVGNGSGDTNPYSLPTLVTGSHSWADVSAYHFTVCGITTAQDAYCWGQNTKGEVGSGAATATYDDPVIVTGGHKWLKIDVGLSHVCGIRTDNTAYCWGANNYGQLGDGNTNSTNNNSPLAVSGGLTFKDITTGDHFTCGLTTSDEIYCWGRDNSGQLGNDAANTNSNVPVIVAGGGTWTSVSTGYNYACALRPDKTAHCWGSGNNGATGLGHDSNVGVPTAVVGGHTWDKLVADGGSYHTCGLEETTGDLYCFGYTNSGETGLDQSESYDSVNTPRVFVRGMRFSDIVLGESVTFGFITP